MKTAIQVLCLIAATFYLSSCATVFGGRVSECQRTMPAKGEPSREVRSAALILDLLLFPPGIAVDYATGAIYKPCVKK